MDSAFIQKLQDDLNKEMLGKQADAISAAMSGYVAAKLQEAGFTREIFVPLCPNCHFPMPEHTEDGKCLFGPYTLTCSEP